jgi:pilus assembly protein Flp/PilA
MNYFIQKAKEFARNEEGVTAIEYGLLAALVAVVIIAAVQSIGTSLNTTFGDVADKLKAPAGGGAPKAP